MENNSVKLIQSVQRAVDILNCFTDTAHYLSINDISKKVGLNINTTRGLINTLVFNGLLIHNKNSSLYSLGFYFIGKANIIQNQVDSYIALAKAHMDKVAEKYHVSSSLQLINQNQVYTIYCAYPANAAYTIVLSEYAPLPLYATSSGKLLMTYNLRPEVCLSEISEFQPYTPHTLIDPEALAHELTLIRKNGHACEIEEFQIGVGSCAAPILDQNKQLIATVSATSFVSALVDIRKPLLDDLKKIAAIISDSLFQ